MIPPDTLILRNYECDASARLATWIAERMAESRHGALYVEPNDGFFDPSRWYEQLKELVDAGVPMIALLSTMLNAPHDTDDPREFPGIALLSELLYLAEQHPDEVRLIPVLIDCSAADLKRPLGEYEQLQDIAVPFVSKLDPLTIDSEAFFGDPVMRAKFANELAVRIR